MDHASDVLDVFRSASQDFRDDEILGANHRNRCPPNVHRKCPLKKLLLKSGAGKDDIEWHAGATMNERKNAGARSKIGIGKHEIEVMPRHRFEKGLDSRGSMAAVTSTSPLRRGLPQRIAACAPNKYHLSFRSAIAAASA